MTESFHSGDADSSASTQSDWWNSGDPRVITGAKTSVATTTTSVISESYATEYRTRISSAFPVHPTTKSNSRTAEIALLISSVLLIIGSLTAWATISVFGHSISASGTDNSISTAYSVNGWVTLAMAIVLVAMAALMMAFEDRSLAAVASVVSVVVAGFGAYFLVRILYDISKAHSAAGVPAAFRASEHVGWGLIVLLIGAAGALVASVSAFRSR